MCPQIRGRKLRAGKDSLPGALARAGCGAPSSHPRAALVLRPLGALLGGADL